MMGDRLTDIVYNWRNRYIKILGVIEIEKCHFQQEQKEICKETFLKVPT